MGGEELRRKCERLSRLCADPESDPAAIRRLGRELYQALIAPVEQHLDPRRTLVIETDGPVSAAPFAALAGGDSQYLGLKYDLVLAGGVWDYLRRHRQPPVDKAAPALVVANPALSGEARRSYPPLAGAAVEGRAVASRFRGAVLLEGTDATLEAVERHRAQAGLFHFAGHGFSHAGNGGLLLAPGGDSGQVGSQVLDGKRLAGQDWRRCRLAILSACSTGTGESSGPVNPESLVRRLLWAGVPRVIATRWRVDSETTRELMEEFYSGLLSGLDTAAALRQACRRIQDREGTRHPYNWAGFQAYGSR
jgi:CHAT domain-containing protein